MGLLEAGDARQQPFGRERGQRRHGQDVVVIPAQQLVGRQPQVIEGGPDSREVLLRRRGEGERAVLADEQGDAQLFLQPLDLMADRGLRDVQLGSGLGKAQMPGGGLEGP